jgi:Cdc6-like AAA superfamily ATPase
VVYIEEVELLFKNEPNHLTEDFMKLFQKKGLRLILIGISNTIDILLKSSSKFCFKMHDVENIIFSPYNASHISEIIKEKLEKVHIETGLKVDFEDRLLKFSSQRLETLKKGDFRVCLEFLKNVVQKSLEVESKGEERFTVKI